MRNVLLVNFPKISPLKEELMNGLASQGHGQKVSVVHKESQVIKQLEK